MMKLSHITECCVSAVQNVTKRNEYTALESADQFADYAHVSIHCLRINFDTSYRMSINLMEEMSQITAEIGLNTAELRQPSTVCKAIIRLNMDVSRVLLDQTAQLHVHRRNAGDLRSLAGDKGYNKHSIRTALRELGIGHLIKHRVFSSYDHAHNARVVDQR